MKKLQSLSFHLHWITLCCFLSPFFYDSCSGKKPEEITQDSTALVVPMEDSISLQNNITDSTQISLDTTNSESTNKKEKVLSETIIEKYPAFKIILIPDPGIHTGLATIINTLPLISLFSTTMAFIFLIIALLGRLLDTHAIITRLLLEFVAVVFLLQAIPYLFFAFEKLWGYWLCVICLSALILIDVYIIFKQKKQAT